MDTDGADLVPLPGFPFPVLASRACRERAERVAARCAKAFRFLSTLLSFQPDVTLWVLAESDWPTGGPPYGMPHFDGRHLVVSGEDADFWLRFVKLLWKAEPPPLARAVAVYGPNLDLGPFFDLLAVHELGHSFHGRRHSPLPRHWLEELFASLCLHTYLANEEPASLPVLVTFPEVFVALDPTFEHQSLEAFEELYSNMDPVNYGWFQCRLHVAARRVYDSSGSPALQRLWQRFVFSDRQLVAALQTDVDPEVARVLTDWPSGPIGSGGPPTPPASS